MTAISSFAVDKSAAEPIICQINGPWYPSSGRLPAQCCGLPGDQIYRCEQLAPSGHRCRVGDHTILHERMGNGYTCDAVQQRLIHGGGLSGWITGTPPIEDCGPMDRIMRDHLFAGDGPYCEYWSSSSRTYPAGDRLTFGSQCGWSRETHPTEDSSAAVAPATGA